MYEEYESETDRLREKVYVYQMAIMNMALWTAVVFAWLMCWI